jgi:hypothetical protein
LDHLKIEKAVRQWLQTVVINLNLCPFAGRVFIENRVRFVVTEASTEEELLPVLADEFDLMSEDDTIVTTLVIHPNVLKDFEAYNEFLSFTDQLIVMLGLTGIYQIASFHPDYQFADTEPGDVENYTNKSPYPMLHILRESSLDAAIDNHPDVSEIPERNIRLMREMGTEKMRALLKACFTS